MKCLIVEDEEFEREMMELFLADYAEVDTARDGVEAVELFSRAMANGAPYRLVCLDIMMPRMDGQQALKQMRKMEKEAGIIKEKAVIIMTTAMNAREDIEEALWQGDCTDYLVKPIILADLLAVIRKYNLID